MKKYFSSLLVAGASAFVFGSCAVSTHVETAAGVNFSNYKTFGWANVNGERKEDIADNDIVDNNIKNAISKQLESKGWTQTTANPDVILDYNVMVEKKVNRVSEPVYGYPYSHYYYNGWRHRRGYMYYPSDLTGYHSYNVPFKQGTLTVNMVDTKTNKLIWQGSAQGDVSNSTVTTGEMQTDVTSIFKKFKLPSTNS
ncbi:MAG TPA: DUF4136 domain-containing protein [Chitinophagaceae bacterium]|nr:DUF4136 domain-containing protein [Chitinophagaceae bacterium]